ncbi:MAG: BlaI/MecI/CopY family transcriptional regulator [Rhodoglobus sp.]
MITLGELERSVMELLWGCRESLSAYDIQTGLADRKLASTTILTVLSRLEKKGFVARDRSSRPHRYSAAADREAHMAELMHEVLGGASDRTAVLERFVGQVSADEAATLRRILDGR